VFPQVLPTYNRTDVAFVRGEGPYLFAEDGQRYLDFGAGIAVNAFGHAHPKLVAALTEQAGKLWHTSNLYRVPGQEVLAKRLTEVTFADTCFFTNSGVEACELAWKMARRYQFVSGHPERFRILGFEGAFQGRTLAAIAAGGNPKYLEGFGPKVEGFDSIPPGDLKAVHAAIGPETAAILIEPIQGEGGVRVISRVKAILDAGIVVCGHIGLTPQSSGQLGGHKAQGRTLEAAMLVVEDARALYQAGVQLLLLEAVPPEVAGFIRAELPIPVLGIGAGDDVDGQLLIVSDVLGIFQAFTPKFVKKYADIAGVATAALTDYVADVRAGRFPEEQHCYRMLEGEHDRFAAWTAKG